ncbi:MAG: hypothetical protein B7733_18005 [Myxococcales bacterium FL481]|nr:MAG: hypothetical protein B7733_18005 [Myxococcales bacterium FL481]
MLSLLKRIRDTIVLPPHISEFEDKYVRRMNRISLAFFALHVPVFVAVAFFNDTGPLMALGLSLAVLVGPVVAYRTLDNPRRVSVVYGFTAMLMGGLLVHFGQGPVQIEMHFYFFALLAMLALFGNPAVILTAAVTVAVHHLALWYYLPSSVFNYDAPIWVVLVHAAFVVLESVATVFIARSFFDNVIGLEKIVNARTKQLDARNQEMRLVLDNVDQGLLTLDAQGVMSTQKSATVERWFGPAQDQQSFADYLMQTAPETATAFEIAFDQAQMGMLPIEVALDQFPANMKVDGRHFALGYTPITHDEALVQLLVVISDVTAAVERERLEAEQREAMRIFDQLLSDRGGFLEFFEEAEQLVANLASNKHTDLRTLKRAVHTLKGNAMLFGVHSIADQCHAIESRIEEEALAPSPDQLLALGETWNRIKGRLSVVLDENTRTAIEIAPTDFDKLLAAALREAPGPQLAKMIADLKLEPTAVRLQRLSDQAKRIARRLGKGDIDVRVEDQMLRLDPERWSSFWSSFVHVVRNAVDHGLEIPEERARVGKSESGGLSIATVMSNGEFVIRLKDDGRGIEWDSVRARAQALGLPSATHADLERALFSDGLSTASEVTEYSGRGVGMGAIRAACEGQGGRMRISSSPGQGTEVEFRFPVDAMAPTPAERLAAAA